MPRIGVFAGLLLAIAAAGPAAGQIADPKAEFLDALGEFSLELEGAWGDEGGRLGATLERLEAGLDAWDASIRFYEADMARQLASAPHGEAATMHAAIGGVYLDRHRIEDAERELEAALELDPDRPDVETLLGLTETQLGRTAEATEAFQRAAELDRRDPARAYVLARHLARTGDADAAARARREFLDRWRRAEADRARGEQPFVRVGLVQEVVGIEPFFPPVRYAQGFARLREGAYRQAVAAFRAAAAGDPLASVPDPAAGAVRRGAAAFRDGDVDAAREALDAAIAAAPDAGEPRRILGLVELADGRFAEAVARLRAAVSLAPADERTRLNLATALTEAEDYGAAEASLRETLGVLPESGRARYALGRLHQRQGQYPEALDEFTRAVSFEPLLGLNGLYETMGALYARGQQFDQAIAVYLARIALTPNDPAAHQDLGEAYVKRGLPDDAMTELAVALMLDPDRTGAYATMAQVHLQAGRYQAALEAADHTLELNVAHREARYVRATALMRLGRRDEGRAELQTFQRLQAEDDAARTRLLQLNGLRREAAVSAASGDYDRAVALRRQVLVQEPGAAASHLELGLALVGAGQLAEAADRLETAAALNAPIAVYRHLAEVYAALGRAEDSQRARETYQQRKRELLRRRSAGR